MYAVMKMPHKSITISHLLYNVIGVCINNLVLDIVRLAVFYPMLTIRVCPMMNGDFHVNYANVSSLFEVAILVCLLYNAYNINGYAHRIEE